MSDDEVPPAARARVAAAVRTSLAKHGYARLTTAKVAAESDLSEAGLYYHYDTKDEMIAAFLTEARGSLDAELDALAEADPEARLRAVCNHLLVDPDETERSGVYVAVMELLAHAPHNETLHEHLAAMERHVLDVVAGVVADGVEQGVFREVDPEGTAALLVAATDGATGIDLALGLEVHDELRASLQDYVDSLLAD